MGGRGSTHTVTDTDTEGGTEGGVGRETHRKVEEMLGGERET